MIYTGVTGKISISKSLTSAQTGSDNAPEAFGAAQDITHMSSWSVDLKRDIVEVLSFGSMYKEKVPSVRSWTASFKGKADFDVSGGQGLLVEAYEDAVKVRAAFHLSADTFLLGEAYVESLSISHSADDTADISIRLIGCNATELTAPR